VTGKTGIEHIARLHDGKSLDVCLAAIRIDVSFTRTVTAFASGTFGCLVSGSNAFIVWVAIKGVPNVGVTFLANIGAYVVGSERRPRRQSKGEDHEPEAHIGMILVWRGALRGNPRKLLTKT
jgi:hypothetical protein